MPKRKAEDRRALFRHLPSIEELTASPGSGPGARLTREARTRLGRRIVEALRRRIEEGEWTPGSKTEALAAARCEMRAAAARITARTPRPVINAAGVVLHTNLGRAPLAGEALRAIRAAGRGYCDLEYDLEAGRRGSRLEAVEELLCVLSGADAALAVNNNAGAVLLALDTLASGREVIVSRGHLVEIGGSFRMPEIMVKSGATIVEVGTTNKTHRRDYERAVTRRTGLILHVHQSNFAQTGFVKQVPLAELVEVGAAHGVPVLDDQGSGIMDKPGRLGAPLEPTVRAGLETGVVAVTCSGDKLLGGSQAGLIFGQAEAVAGMKANPLARALRLDKLQLAVLQATIRLYLTGRADTDLPVRAMALATRAELTTRANQVRDAIRAALDRQAEAGSETSPVTVTTAPATCVLGGGSSPDTELPDRAVVLRPKSGVVTAAALDRALRRGRPPVVARVSEEQVILTIRTVLPSEQEQLVRAVVRAVGAARRKTKT